MPVEHVPLVVAFVSISPSLPGTSLTRRSRCHPITTARLKRLPYRRRAHIVRSARHDVAACNKPPTDTEVASDSKLDDASGDTSAKSSTTANGVWLDVPRAAAGRVVSALKAAVAPGGFLWGMVTGCCVAALVIFLPESSIDASLREKVAIFDLILQDISSSYVDTVDLDKLFETGVNSMLGTLDPYTQFENNAEALEMSVRTSGKYAGVGLGISATTPPEAAAAAAGAADGTGKDEPGETSNQITVVSAFEGYAFDAGVRPGDVIQAVDDTSVSGLTLEQVTDLLRGEPGTQVAVKVRREGRAQPLKFLLDRRQITIRDVPVVTLVGAPENGIGYIRLQSFAKDAANEVRNGITQLIADANEAAPGRGLRGLVLDLRGNPGGLLNAAVEVSESFVPRDSVIVSTSGRGINDGPTYRSQRDPILPSGTRLAVLVNGQTASASEIVSGAIQDLDLGVVVGSRTFGKGLVQNVQELPKRTALKYTVGKYLTPSGRCIQATDYRQGGDTPARIASDEKTHDKKARPRAGVGSFEARDIPDGERRTFRTAGGRPVRDGGGIEPDVSVSKRASFLEVALLRQNMFFKYANRYVAERDLEALPEPFTVNDATFRDFVAYVSSAQFRYESQFDDALDELDAVFDAVGYNSARARVADLRHAAEHEMREDFSRHRDALRSLLESAIRYRLQPDSVRIKAELRNDEQLAAAVRVLENPREYSAVLQPPPNVQQAIVDAAATEHAELNG